MSDSEDHIDNVPDDAGDDLFGDEDVNDDQPLSEIGEDKLSDRDLQSDREDEVADRHHDEVDGMEDEEPEFRSKTVADTPLYRHRIPKSGDGSLYSFKVPDFIKLNPIEYNADTWEPSKWDLRNARAETPIPTVMRRRDPKTGKMQSNTNIYRWSDGSVTMAVGDEHYEIQSKPLAPPSNKPYQEVQDAHYYAAAAHLTTNSLVIIGHFTEQYMLRPNKNIQDHALERLKAELATAKKERGPDMIILAKEDPELQKKQAEMAERERAKAQRRRETAAARVDGAGGRFKGGALSIGDLEGGRRGRKRGAPGGGKKKNRRPEYDSDDELPNGRGPTDKYDLDDGFLVDSDEESEEVEDDEEEEELLDDDDEEEEAPRRKRQRTAEADDEDGAGTTSHRRRRAIVDDDDE
ncbi:Leo1-like protein-domain-containing protein [Neurospora tetraspora]|uniref:Leo1-like protein-domain-containing protein n=1 Tax=Neurospora tetraspora TaxID=94610 RepID=A0AAE0JP24_9PEZI|nr:Leo1-like protein-domain-containing protein [Neurospora tetraspora]